MQAVGLIALFVTGAAAGSLIVRGRWPIAKLGAA